MKKGFTLVELAIVLVVIGVIIGGILVANSMMSAANVTAQVAQFQQFDAGGASFKAKYNFMPGDAPAFGGNGNGSVDSTNPGNPGDTSVFICEIANFWNQLIPDKYAAGGCASSSRPVYDTATPDVPLSKIGKKNSYVMASWIYYAIMDPSQAQTITFSWYHFKPTTVGNNNSALKPIDLSALDTKMDDGNGITGYVLSGGFCPGGCGGNCGYVCPTTSLSTCSNGSGVYQVQNNSYVCTAVIQIGGQTGDPQP